MANGNLIQDIELQRNRVNNLLKEKRRQQRIESQQERRYRLQVLLNSLKRGTKKTISTAGRNISTAIPTQKQVRKFLKGVPKTPKKLKSIPISTLIGTRKPEGVNPLKPNIESLIFPSGRALEFQDQEKVKEGSILKQKSIFFR